MIRFLFTVLFLCLWLPMLSFTQHNVSLEPPLAARHLTGPMQWRIEGRSIGREGFALHGAALVNGRLSAVTVKTDPVIWAQAETSGALFAADRTFVTERDLMRDTSMRYRIGQVRFNGTFLLWGFLTALLQALFFLWLSGAEARVESPAERWRYDEAIRVKTRDLEIDYKGRTAALRLHTAAIAFAGYAALFAVVALLLFIGVKFALVVAPYNKYVAIVGLVPVFFAFKLARVLRVRGGDSGVRVTRKEARKLFTLLDKIQTRVSGPQFSRVFIDMEMNASVSRHTGFLGFFGFGPVTLTLGLPLMQSLSVNQLAGVLAHEYGHVAARDNALGQWVYRIRHSWQGLSERLKTEKIWYALRLDICYRAFMRVFIPYSFALSRRCEYHADAFAAKVAGANNIAEALVAMEVRGEAYAKAMKTWWKKADTFPDPTGAFYQAQGDVLKEISGGDLAALLKKKTHAEDTHPSLRARLAKLKRDAEPVEPLEKSAAERLLGASFERQLSILFDRAWKDRVRKQWKDAHRARQHHAHNFALLLPRRMDLMTEDELFRFATAALVLEESTRATEAFREILKRDPENVSAQLNLQGLKLLNGDEGALIKMDDIARTHPNYTAYVCEAAIRHFEKQERLAEAEVYRFRLKDWNYQLGAAEEERRHIFHDDIFAPHGIAAEHAQKISGLIRRAGVKTFWMARKRVHYMKDKPAFIIGLKGSRKNRAATLRVMEESLRKSGFPDFFRFFWVDEVRGLESRLKRVARP